MAFRGRGRYEKDKEELRKLAEKANELLIEKHKDEEAISWRFNELRNRTFPFKEQTDVHSVSTHERELREKEFAAPLMKLKHPQYEKQFLDLLGKSFNILKKRSIGLMLNTYGRLFVLILIISKSKDHTGP